MAAFAAWCEQDSLGGDYRIVPLDIDASPEIADTLRIFDANLNDDNERNIDAMVIPLPDTSLTGAGVAETPEESPY